MICHISSKVVLLDTDFWCYLLLGVNLVHGMLDTVH